MGRFICLYSNAACKVNGEARMGRDGTGWDGMGWDGMGWDGMGVAAKELRCSAS